MVRKKFKKLLQSIVTKYLILGIFTVSLLYPNLPAKKTSSDNNQLTFKTGLFSSQLTSSIAGIDTSLDVTSSGAKVSLSRHQSQITFATPLDDASMSHHQNKVSYQVPNKNIEVRYQLLPNGLKEDIILNKIPRETVFKTNLSLKNLKVDTSGKTPVFYDLQGNYQFHIQAPYAIDNQGKVTYDLKYHLVNQKDNPQEYILALEIDPSWLHDPSRVLPITIDPTVVHDTVSEFSGGQFNRIAQIGTGETAPELTTYYQENNSDLHTVGLWHLNEVSGDTVLDSSGNNNQGLATGTTIVDGLLGKSRNFNGTSGTISIGNTATLDFERTDSFSIEAWINTSTTNQGVIFSKRQSSAPLTGYELRRETNGIISFIIANTSTSNMLMVQTTNSVPTTGWHHVAATYNGSSSPNGIAIYINGLPQATTTSYNSLSASIKTSISAMIGSRNSTTFFDGRIDEVRVSNIVRSLEEIKMSASRRPYGVYTSPIIDYNNSVFSWNSFSWTELGVATGDGETLYDSTDLVAKWDFNTVNSSASNSGGTCGSSCNGSLIRFNNVTGIDTPPSAVGGTLSIAGGYNTHTFLGGYTTLATTHNIGAVEMLVVAGGGGGANTGSGGGAGGYQYRTAYTGFQYGAGSYGISVGAGGIGGTATSASGTNGGTSQITEPGSGIIFQVIGGGGGVSHGGAAGQNGGSGSGGPIRTSAPAALGGRNSGGIGNSGGTGLVDAGWVGNSGGGGGAGAQGANGGNTAGSGNGGIGRTNSITGTNTYYAGGGGGGEVNGSYAGAGGAGGGGSAVVDGVGGSGTPNTGGGGAGGSYNGTYFNGGNGGSGITIIKYPNTSSGWTANRRWGSLAMEFDGVNDSITIPAHSSLNFSQTSPFSIETWVKLDSLKDQVIINKQRNTTNEFIYALRIGSSGKAVFEVAKQNVSSTTVTSTKALETDKWHFIVGTSDGTSINLYVDGVLQGTATIGFTSATQSLADLYIGQLYDESQFLSGFLDSTRIYSRTLGAREILANYNPGNIEFQTRVGNSSDPNDGTWDDWSPITNETSLHTLDTTPDFSPVSYWSLNESIGTSISDLRSGNHGYTINATISSGKFDVGRSLAGTGYAYVPHHTSLGFTGNFTISAWVNPSTGGNRQIISKTGAGGTGGFALLVGNMGEVFCRTDNGSTWVDSSTAWGDLPSSTGWHHVVAVRNGTSCRIYIDGIDETNSPGTHTSMVGNTFPLVIGARSDLSTEYWNGGIDDVRIYDKALSATQITTLYNIIPTRLHSSGFTADTSVKAEGASSMTFSTDPPKVDAQTVGLWHLDETGNSGAYIKDSSINGNHGTPVGTTWTKGVFNGARYFNGSADEINLGNIGITDSKADITIEAWVYSTTSDANHHRVFTENNVVYVGQYGTQAAFYMGNGTGWDNYSYTMGNIPLNQWVHVAWVKSGTTGYVYINGQLTGSMIAPATLGTSSNTNYISGQGSIQRWGGSIDEVKISNVARSSQEIAESYRLARNQYLNLPINNTDLSGKNSLPFYIAADRPGSYLSTIIGESDYANYQPDSNTVGLWHLDDLGLDDSANNNQGTLTGTTTTQGKLGQARYFNGTSHIGTSLSSVANDLFAQSGVAWTVDAWFKSAAPTGTNQMIVGRGGGTGGSATFALYLDGAGNLASNVRGVNTTLAPTVANGKWHHSAITWDGTTAKAYLNGQEVTSPSIGTAAVQTYFVYIGATANGTSNYFIGEIDEVRISNIARTAEEIRQASTIDRRIHQVTIDFGAKLVSSNLINDSTDDTFLIDATAYGLNSNGSSLYLGDKIIIQENVNGTQYTAQGTVNSVNTTSGLVSVSSWDSSSSFPAGGYTQNANVFKWQREYLPLNGITSTHRDSVNDFTIFINNGHEGRNIWIDDLRSAGSYLTNNIGSTITSAIGKRYFQYRSIFTSHDYDVSSSITQVSSNYTTNFPPDTPTLISPSNASANQSLTPTFRTVTTDTDSDHLQYELKICTNQNMTDSCITLDQTSSNVGWSGMNVGTSAFSSGTTAVHILQTGTSLAYNTTYYWRTRAIDPSGSNTWSDAQTTPFYFSTDTTPNSPSVCTIDQTSYPGSYLIKWLDTSTDESGFEVYRIKNGANTLLTTTVSNATSHTDNDIQPGNTYAYKIRSVKTATGGTTAYSGYCDTTQLNPDIGSTLLQGLRLEGLQLN